MKYRLLDYWDVWGNAEDGWEVNDLCVAIEGIEIAENATDNDIIEYLIQNGFIWEGMKDDIVIEWTQPEFIEIYIDNDEYPMYPVGRLEVEP